MNRLVPVHEFKSKIQEEFLKIRIRTRLTLPQRITRLGKRMF